MAVPIKLLRELEAAPASTAWDSLFSYAWGICSAALTADSATTEVTRRDLEIGSIDLFLATAGWDLWRSFEAVAPRTAPALTAWWGSNEPGRAVLILDALSLREAPWLLQGAKQRGYTIHQARATGAELPADTTPFAVAVGFTSRSEIQNNGGATKGKLPGAFTDSTNLPFGDCATQVNAAKDWLLWHHWPDDRLHDLAVPGHGLAGLTREAATKLSSETFWSLVHALTAGRRLVITSDHGYAASGHFPDTADAAQTQYLKDRFKSRRWAPVPPGGQAPGSWVPPLDLQLNTVHEHAAFALGRRKWKSQGGYPTLTHGGLSLLEVAVPFLELSRTGGA